jgi:class 3 adenylate cyclase
VRRHADLFEDLRCFRGCHSTALSARMDPEDLREVISAYQKCVAETVQRFGGFVANRTSSALTRFAEPKPR